MAEEIDLTDVDDDKAIDVDKFIVEVLLLKVTQVRGAFSRGRVSERFVECAILTQS